MFNGNLLPAWLSHPLALVSVGSAVGGSLRYWLGSWIERTSWWHGIPAGTLCINVSGSFVIGFLAVAFLERLSPSQREAYLLLGTGLCGGFTTFSTFEWETYKLVREGSWPMALTYIAASCLGGFIAVFAGATLAHGIFGRS